MVKRKIVRGACVFAACISAPCLSLLVWKASGLADFRWMFGIVIFASLLLLSALGAFILGMLLPGTVSRLTWERDHGRLDDKEYCKQMNLRFATRLGVYFAIGFVLTCAVCYCSMSRISEWSVAFVDDRDGETTIATGPAFVWYPNALVRPKVFNLSVHRVVPDGDGGFHPVELNRRYSLVPKIVRQNMAEGFSPPTPKQVTEEALRIIDATPLGPDFEQRFLDLLDRTLLAQGLRLTER